jgi:hypothetical protein
MAQLTARPWDDDVDPLYGGNPFTWFQAGLYPEHYGGEYNSIFGLGKGASNDVLGQLPAGEGPGGFDITQMSLDDVIEFTKPEGAYAQWVARTRDDGRKGQPAGPMGFYQIINSNLPTLKDRLGLTGEEKFTPELQDRLGEALLMEKPAWNKYVAGISDDKNAAIGAIKSIWGGWADPDDPTQDHYQNARGWLLNRRVGPTIPGGEQMISPPQQNMPQQAASALQQRPPMAGAPPQQQNLLQRLLGGGGGKGPNLMQVLGAFGEGMAASYQGRPVDQATIQNLTARQSRNMTAEALERRGYPDLANMLRAGQITGGQAMQYMAQVESAKSKTGDPTALMRNAAAAGLSIPEFLEMQSPRPYEKEGEKVLGKSRAQRRSNMEDAAYGANNRIAELRLLQSLLGQMNTGAGTNISLALKRAGTAIGLDWGQEGDIATAEAIQSLSGKLALELRNPAGGAGMPGAMSDNDLKFLKRMVPDIEKEDWANEILIEAAIRIQERNQEILDKTDELVGRKLQFGSAEFRAEMKKWAEANPLYDDLTKAITSIRNAPDEAAGVLKGMGL